jgi:hypothetical protein
VDADRSYVRQDDEAVTVVEEHSPDPDVRLIRNIWARKGVLERVRGVKFMSTAPALEFWNPLESSGTGNLKAFNFAGLRLSL